MSQFCSHCGNRLEVGQYVCTKCGFKVSGQGIKVKTTAVLLALLLGGVGVHRFYLGENKMGIIYIILFCLTAWWFPFIIIIMAIVDFIRLICMDIKEFDLKYNRKGY